MKVTRWYYAGVLFLPNLILESKMARNIWWPGLPQHTADIAAAASFRT